MKYIILSQSIIFGASKKLCIIKPVGVQCISLLLKLELLVDATLELKIWDFEL
jgi:hypothetical protein